MNSITKMHGTMNINKKVRFILTLPSFGLHLLHSEKLQT